MTYATFTPSLNSSLHLLTWNFPGFLRPLCHLLYKLARWANPYQPLLLLPALHPPRAQASLQGFHRGSARIQMATSSSSFRFQGQCYPLSRPFLFPVPMLLSHNTLQSMHHQLSDAHILCRVCVPCHLPRGNAAAQEHPHPTGQGRALSTWNPARSRQSPLFLGKSPASEEICYLTKTLLG